MDDELARQLEATDELLRRLLAAHAPREAIEAMRSANDELRHELTPTPEP
ncbi:MAG: hypothetical protein S0880_33905 [Actinomycetota bacterium]|nr:hypothetical protein [Actinomycetota bacterium]